jgi:hypothetical protein
MNLFGNLSTEGLEQAEDRLGGFTVHGTDIYDSTVKAMYAGESDGGALSVTVVLQLPGGKEYSETVYITNKQKQNFFLNKQDKTKKVPLPGFTLIEDICLIASGKPLSEQTTEEKTVNTYNKDLKKQVPTVVPMLVDCIGGTLSVAILKVLENKNVKDSSGTYQPTAEERESNRIDKVFDTGSKMTVLEAKSGATEAKFWDGWSDKNKDKTRDERKIKNGQGAVAGKASAGVPQAGGAAPARVGLFGKKA